MRICHLHRFFYLGFTALLSSLPARAAEAKIMSTEPGRVLGATESFAVEAPPAGPAAKLAAKVGKILKTKKDALNARPVTTEDRIARLKQKLAGRTLPSVAISIPEQH